MRRLLLSLLALIVATVGLTAAPAVGAPVGSPVVTVDGFDDVSITFSWTAVASGNLGTISYSTSVATAAAPGTPVDTAGPFAAPEPVTFSGLTANTAYIVTVTATDTDLATTSGTASQTTAIAAPGTPVVTIGVATDSTLAATWTATDGGGTNTYVAIIDPPGDGGGLINGTADTSTTFTGLTPGTNYTVTVTATNETASSAAGTNSGTTNALVPDAPGITGVSPGTTDAIVNFTTPDGNGSAVTGFTISATPSAGGATLTQPVAAPATNGTITGLAENTAYNFTVTATNGVGEGPSSAVVSGTTGTTAPETPTITLGTVTASSIGITWVVGGGAATYTTTITPNDGTVALSAGAATFSGLNPGTPYTIEVEATNAGGTVSDTDSATTSINGPGAVTVTPGATTGTSIAASWGADAGGGTNNYTATIAPNDGGGAGAVTNSAATNTTFTGLTPGQTYTITVVANNGSGTANGTAQASTGAVAPGQMAAPRIGVSSATSVLVEYDAPASTGGSAITGYTVTLTSGSGTPRVANPGPGTLSASFTGLTPGQTYTAVVTATNAAGTSPASPSSSTALLAPPAPANLTATATAANPGQVVVAWDAANGAATYEVTLSNGGGNATVNGTTATFNGLASGSYTATVVARNSGGTSPSATSAAAGVINKPSTPRNVDVSLASTDVDGVSFVSGVLVTWDAPTSDGGDPITSYIVRMSPADVPDFIFDATGSEPLSVEISGLETRTAYSATVIAVNAAGESAGTNSPNTATIPAVPGAAEDVVSNQLPMFSGNVQIQWNPPTDDGGSPVTQYVIKVGDASIVRTVAELAAEEAAAEAAAAEAGVAAPPFVPTVLFNGIPVGEYTPTIQTFTAAGPGGIVTANRVEVRAFAPFRSETDFVDQVYRDFLRREADAGGRAFWTARINDDQSNISEIIEGFMRSPEFSPRRAVTRLYYAYFDRQPDLAGVDFWAAEIAAGRADVSSVSDFFASSTEFDDTYGSLNDAEFIVLVYNNVLGRRPDQAGFVFWLAQLEAGFTRGDLMLNFSESPENVEATQVQVDVTVTYLGLLRRPPETTCGRPGCVPGFQFWRGEIRSDPNGLDRLIRSFFASDEYAQRVAS